MSHLKVSDEGRRSGRDKAPLRQNARLHIVELQAGVVTRHLTWCVCRGGEEISTNKTKNKSQLNKSKYPQNSCEKGKNGMQVYLQPRRHPR